jgi:DNA-3-methyladenine glycosylase
MQRLDQSFFKKDIQTVARALLGQYLCRETEDGLVSGIIVETEAYLSSGDPACHAHRGMTARNAKMFGPPGHAYIYYIYGSHYCFNVVTGPTGTGEAVLIRAVEPVDGIDLMRHRRGAGCKLTNLTSGPGKLCQAFAIDRSFDGHDLQMPPLYLAMNIEINDKMAVRVTPRIGISSARDMPLRFVLVGNQYLSRRECLE